MHIKPFRLLPLLFVALALVKTVWAATPVVHVSPRPNWLNTVKAYDKKIPTRQVQNGYFYQLVEEQIQVEKQADYKHYITEIVTDAGIQNASQISVAFDPLYEKLDFHQITVWRNGQSQQRLSVKDFKIIADEQELSRFIYQGSYSAYCILSDIRKGDKIEWSYTITGRNPIFGDHFARMIYFQWNEPIAHIYRSVQATASRPLSFKYFNKVPQLVTADKKGVKSYEWEDFQVQPATDHKRQPNWYNEYAYVQISDFKSWQEVTNWALSVNPLATNIKGKLAQRIAELKAASGGDKEKYFRSAAKVVQDEVRYMGVEIGEYSHRANTPEKVYNQRYGDCKDKALLLASMLNANGIEAHMVLVDTDYESHIADFLPSPNIFDHAVMVATLNGKQVWVDATMSYQRGLGTDIYFPSYGKGLIIKPGGSALADIGRTKAGKSIYQETFTIDKADKVKLDVKTIYTLNEADQMRSKLASSSMAETEKDYLNYYAKTYPKISATDSVTVKDDEDKNELITYEHYLVPDFFKRDSVSGAQKASFFAGYINSQLFNVPNKLHTPLALYYPDNVEYDLKIISPKGWDIADNEENVNRNAYSFNRKVHADGDTLNLNYQFSYLADYLPADKLDEYRSDSDHIYDDLLSYSIDYSPGVNQSPFNLNYGMLLYVLVLAAALTGLAIKLYRTETDAIIFAHGAGFTAIGGWLYVVAVALIVSPLAIMVSMVRSDYFTVSTWNMQIQGSSSLAIRSMLIFETTFNVVLIGYCLFCVVLLLNRRDILPKYITGLYILNLAYAITDYIFAYNINNGNVTQNAALAIVKAMVGAVIWIPYFKRSSRVEETFIVPYPPHNYSYDEHEGVQIQTDTAEPV